MIKKLTANRPSFKTVEFTPGFNVIWADRTKESTKLHSRNGLGKSTLIEILHFCLGANASKGKGLLVDALSGWEFTLELEVNKKPIFVTRAVDEPNSFFVKGDTGLWPLKPKLKKERFAYARKDWVSLLGVILYGLPLDSPTKYQPTFRSLISYSIRRGKDAFSTPFEHFRKQLEWDKQVNNAFLLGLAWDDAADLQVLKDQRKGLENLKKAASTGVLAGYIGSQGELEARRVRLQRKAESDKENITAFKVHPQYEEMREEANRLTEELHELANRNTTDRRMASLYEKSLSDEDAPVANTVERLYADAGVVLPGVTLRKIEEVQAFHLDIIQNRRSFLAAEVSRLKKAIAIREQEIRQKSIQRSGVMSVLESHGALEEYTLIQKRYLETVSELNSITASIDNLRSCTTGLGQITIDQGVLQQKAQQDYEERREIWEKSIVVFNSYSEKLYEAPGRLVIDISPTGFKFNVEIDRSGSGGIDNMKIFCYDMTCTTTWSVKTPSPKVLIHDSIIFDGVDERQRALALEIAARESEIHGFQYICTLNTDYVPWHEFSDDFDLKSFIRLTLTDEKQDGSLLGIRF